MQDVKLGSTELDLQADSKSDFTVSETNLRWKACGSFILYDSFINVNE